MAGGGPHAGDHVNGLGKPDGERGSREGKRRLLTGVLANILAVYPLLDVNEYCVLPPRGASSENVKRKNRLNRETMMSVVR